MTTRRFPRWSELKPLLRPRSPQFAPTERRLSRSHTITDLRAVARRRTPRGPFDYTDGAAEAEISLGRARESFRNVVFHPHVLRNVSTVDASTEILGARSALPFAFAPTGFTRMMQHEGERAVARVAERTGIPFALSTMGTTSIEEVAEAAPQVRKWFQLYIWKDREASKALINRALDAGYDTLVLTVDTPVGGARMRDVRNGLTVPPALTPRTFIDGALHPAWTFNMLTTEPLSFASLSSFDGTVSELINRMFDPTVTFADLEWLRSFWPHKLIVKGIQNTTDAHDVVAAGADAIVLSNHGGRQLDRAPTPLELLPHVVDELDGRAEVLLDTGILSGADIIAALARGASGCLVGRAFLYGLMAGGERGVTRAVEILHSEITRTMQLLGVSDIAQLQPEHATLKR